jgi:hypothetical protein
MMAGTIMQNSEKTGWSRFLAIDPLWFDDAGVIHVKPTAAPTNRRHEQPLQSR